MALAWLRTMSGSGNEVAVAAEVEVDVTQIRQLALTGKWVEIIRQLGPSLDTTNVNEYSPKVRNFSPSFRFPLPRHAIYQDDLRVLTRAF